MAFKFVKGSDITVMVNIIDKTTNEPYPLTGASGIAEIAREDGTILAKTITVVSADRGQAKFDLTDAETVLLPAGNLSFQVTVDQGAKRTIVLFEEAIECVEQLF